MEQSPQKTHLQRTPHRRHKRRQKTFVELTRDEVLKQIVRSVHHVEDEIIVLEKDTAEKVKQWVGARYLLIRQSKVFPIVCRMILSGAKGSVVAKYLKENDEERFAGYTDIALSNQVNRFANEIITKLSQESTSHEAVSEIDLISERFTNREFNPLQIYERSILAQESRLDRALQDEAKFPFTQAVTGNELERLTRLCANYLALRKLLGLAPDKFSDALARRSVRVTQLRQTFIDLPPEKKKDLFNLVEYANALPAAPIPPAKGEGAVPVPVPQS